MGTYYSRIKLDSTIWHDNELKLKFCTMMGEMRITAHVFHNDVNIGKINIQVIISIIRHGLNGMVRAAMIV